MNSCLKCLGVMLNFKPFLEEMATFIDGHLAPVYQILESRLVPECDEDILRIAVHFARNSEMPQESLITAVGDMALYYSELLPHSPEILELVDETLELMRNSVDGPAFVDDDTSRQVRTNASSVWQLTKAMIIEAAKTANEMEGVDQIAINNGALACQISIQVLSPYLVNQVADYENLLDHVASLAESLGVSSDSFLYSRLYGVFCSGFIYLPELTIGYLEKRQVLGDFLRTMNNKSNSFVTSYDRKLQILALLAIFKAKLRQETLDEIAVSCLDASILTLHVQRMEEDIKLSGNQKSLGKDDNTRGNRGPLNDSDKQDIAVYNMLKGKTYHLDQLLHDEADNKQESDEILEFMVGTDREAKRSLVNLKSKIMQIDEFREFVQMFAELKAFFREKLNQVIVEKLSSPARIVLPGILQCQKIETVVNEKQQNVDTMPRKIVKVKARPPQQ